MRRNAIFLIGFLIFAIGMVSEAAAKRVALVIANSDYEYAEKLINPTNDARAIADAFRRLDFDKVTLKENLNYRNLRLALKDFANESAGAELAMVYFAGHGIEVSGQNYLIPTDARLESATDIDFEGIPLPSVMSSVEGANNLKLVILDACRNNPFRSRMALRSGTRSIGRGLAPVEPDNNTLVAFAAKEGTVALDGDGEHSPYANALLQVVEQPGVEIGFMFRRVRDLVLKATGLRQEPFTYGSLGGTPIYLKSPAKTVDAKETAESEDRIAKLREELDELKRQFNQGKTSDSKDNKKSEEVVVAKAETKTRENATAEQGPSTQDEFSGQNGPQVVASAQPTPTSQEKNATAGQPTNPIEQSATPELVTGIQRELARLKCNPGRADGLWGLRTSSAIANVNKESGKKLSTTGPAQETLDALRAMQGPVCKTPAPQIVKPTPVKPKPKVVKKTKPPVAKKNPYSAPKKNYSAPKKKKKEYWGGEDTRLGCESGAEITEKCF
ncbi:MAG: caspase family protein [Hyphomicrobiaceae bacterium]|nr:caspase family protein [Hyphomicrobiaceae bacterium]